MAEQPKLADSEQKSDIVPEHTNKEEQNVKRNKNMKQLMKGRTTITERIQRRTESEEEQEHETADNGPDQKKKRYPSLFRDSISVITQNFLCSCNIY